jgi:biotin carboxyl carrier protein
VIVEVNIGEETPHRYQLRRDGERIIVDHLDETSGVKSNCHGARTTSIDWQRPQPGIYSLLIDNVSYEVFIEDELDHLTVHLENRTYRVQAADVRRYRAVTNALPETVDRLARITAPIPGRVARILVHPGQQVRRGDGVIVLEAMKMENELRSPGDGVIGTIAVEEGQAVEGGALLATIE